MNHINLTTLTFLFILIGYQLGAQCPAGEVEVTIEVSTDQYGYEAYWELTPSGNNCGNAPIFSGGNFIVGCAGGGLQTATPGNGYTNSATITEGPWCLTTGNSYTIHFIDDYGDGGLSFKVFVSGFLINEFTGTGSGNQFTFTANEPPAYDIAVDNIVTPYGYSSQGQDVRIAVKNYGTETITSLDLSYNTNGGSPETTTISSLNILNDETVTVTHTVPWSAANGSYAFNVEVSNPNGNTDEVPANNTASRNVEVGPGIPNIIGSFINNSSVTFQEIGNASNQLVGPTDLDFHPTLTRKELWVVNKRTENQGGSTVTFSNTNLSNQTSEYRTDGNAWHFMSLPTGIAFGENENFGTSPGVFDANHTGSNSPFTGPTLWDSDPAIYAMPSGGNGSHIDMLHESPRCQGIAHEKDNVYWVFDGHSNDIVRYDFVDDHGPGNDYHGDALVSRYSDVTVAKDPNDKVVSHLVLDKSTGWLYVVDYGNARVFRMDINSGSQGGTPSFPPTEPLTEYNRITGYAWEDVVTTGLTEPAGIDIIDNRMLVSDYATGDIVIFDISSIPATELGRVNTGAQGIMGIKIGPDGNIYYVDYDANKVMVAESGISGIKPIEQVSFKLFPNPSNDGKINLQFADASAHSVTITNNLGQIVGTYQVNNTFATLEANYAAGIYLVEVTNLENGARSTRKLILN